MCYSQLSGLLSSRVDSFFMIIKEGEGIGGGGESSWERKALALSLAGWVALPPSSEEVRGHSNSVRSTENKDIRDPGEVRCEVRERETGWLHQRVSAANC